MSDDGFVVVTWPKSQLVMDDPDFEAECSLINDEVGLAKFGPSAYYVPMYIYMRTYTEIEK